MQTATTSSRLNRNFHLSPQVCAKQQEISDHAIAYCHTSLNNSRFFSLLACGSMSQSLMQYAFLQYGLWRDRLHQWFALCILKASSCTDPDQKLAIMSLADHTFTDLQDGHSEMFLALLQALDLGESELQVAQRSPATIAYERSFFDKFGYETSNFYEALAGLSGRELCVSVRNQRILQEYFDVHQLEHPEWLALHAELEIDHFLDAIRPVLIHYAEDSVKLLELSQAVEQSIDRHVQYFDDLLSEFDAAIA
jgi:thiaminase